MIFTRTALLSASLAAFSVTSAHAATPVTREELPALVKEVILNNPEIMMEAAQKLREKQQAEESRKAKDALVKYKTELFDAANSPSAGAADADVTIVEFFDYHCGYCKHLTDAISKTLAEDKKVRFLFREFPILSEDSVAASRAALAVNRLDKTKYFDFHVALMKHDGAFDEKAIMDIAAKVGIDGAKLKAEMAKKEITDALDKNRQIASDLGVRGTPALIMGEDLIPGALSYEEMKQALVALRASKSAASEVEKSRSGKK